MQTNKWRQQAQHAKYEAGNTFSRHLFFHLSQSVKLKRRHLRSLIHIASKISTCLEAQDRLAILFIIFNYLSTLSAKLMQERHIEVCTLYSWNVFKSALRDMPPNFRIPGPQHPQTFTSPYKPYINFYIDIYILVNYIGTEKTAQESDLCFFTNPHSAINWRPLKNVHFYSSSRKAEIGQKGTFSKGFDWRFLCSPP